MRAVIAGASGFVGRRLSESLRWGGHTVVPLSRSTGHDLRNPEVAARGCQYADVVFNLAAQVGGIGFIEANDADCMFSAVINANLLRACTYTPPGCFFYASSSCVYPGGPLAQREHFALPAHPHTGYGWDKIFSEQMCLAFEKDKGIPTAIARFHTLYGPGDNRPPGREHVVEALCKKFVAAKLTGNRDIKIWGDGNQTRSFLYIDDCVDGILRMMWARLGGTRGGPLNLAHPEAVSVNQIVSMLEDIAGIKANRIYDTKAPTGIIHKTSDNAALRAALHWEPGIPLHLGLEKTFRYYYDQAVRKDVWQTSAPQTR